MNRAPLTPEEIQRFEDYAIAQSVINDFEAWWRENWPRLGNVEAGGLWAGGRRSMAEVYKLDSLRQALLDCGIAEECKLLDLLFGSTEDNAPPALLTAGQ